MKNTDSAVTAEKQQEKFIKMTTSPVEKLILSLAAPTILSMLITTLYNLADTFFVGRLNQTSATGAVGVAYSFMSIIQAMGFFFGHGSGNFISRELGKRNTAKAEEMASVGFFSAFITGCILMVLGLVFISPLCTLLGSTETILPYAVQYLRYILIGTPFICSALVMNNQLRYQGNALFAMIGLTSGGILNIALDPLFIFVFDLGVSGAAIATCISQIVSFILLMTGIYRSDNLKIRLRTFRPSLYYYKMIINGGLPSLARNALASVATIVLNTIAGGYGDAAVAAMSIVQRIMMFSQSVVIGFGQGFQPVCGFNYGAAKYSRVKKAFLFCVKYATFFLIIVAAILICLSGQAIQLFQKSDPDVIAYGTRALRFQAVSMPLMATVVLSNMATQTMGKAVKATILAMARQGITFIPSVIVLTLIFKLNGLFAAQFCADILAFIITIPIITGEMRGLDKAQAAEDAKHAAQAQ